jgi:uncharacterized protein
VLRSLLLPALLLAAVPAACRPAGQAQSQPQGLTSQAEQSDAQAALPALTGRVVDLADLLPPNVETRLAAASASVERDIGAQYVIVTIPDLNGEAIERFGVRLGRAWRVGRKGHDDGLMLIVAPNERKVRIEVGYGLEKRVTDAYAARIIREDIIPRFGAGDFAAGIEAGSAALIARLRSRQSDRGIAATDRMVS